MRPLPHGFRIALDPSVRTSEGGRVLAGGAPARVLRLTEAGRAAVEGLRSGRADSEAARTLGRRLVDAGLATAVPPRGAGVRGVTVVVPVRDRARELDACVAALGGAAPTVVVDDGSRDAAAVAAVCARHGAELVRRESPGGPAAARNAALPLVDTPLVAFVDSDVVLEPAALGRLVDHFADPLVGAVAPRVRPAPDVRPSVRRRFLAARSPLDLGARSAEVVPGAPVPWVPSAMLVVRRAALADGFDPELRYGEDVDLVWRLHDRRWRVRYDASVGVAHVEPASWPGVLRRRFRYGRSAAVLARRHPRRVTHLVLEPVSALAAVLVLAARPRGAAAVAALHAALLARRTRGRVPTATVAARTCRGVGATLVGLGRAGTILAAPALLAALLPRRTRAAAAALLVAPPLEEWARRRPPLDPVRWTAACVADDVAYGLGVWRGCAAERTALPLRPQSWAQRTRDLERERRAVPSARREEEP